MAEGCAWLKTLHSHFGKSGYCELIVVAESYSAITGILHL